jgi:hypothetical protein
MVRLTFFVLTTLTVFQQANAQSVNDIPLKDLNAEYVQIVGTSKPLTNKITVEIDFGQETKSFPTDKEVKIKDANGKNMLFNSMVDALNFMAKNGYEFVQAYALNMSNSQNTYYYILHKKKQG